MSAPTGPSTLATTAAREASDRPRGTPTASSPRPERSGANRTAGVVARVGWWALPAVVLAGFGWALLARRHGLWYDELYTAEVAPIPLGDLARAVVRGEGTIPYLLDAPPSYNAPYYAVLHVWLAVTGLAPDEIGLRLPSLLCALGGVAAATRAVGRMAGRRVAVAFGLVVAANPFVVEYAVEARGYGLVLLAAGLAMLAFARWLDGCPRAAVLVGLAATGLGLAHWFGLLVVGALGVAALVPGRGRPPRGPVRVVPGRGPPGHGQPLGKAAPVPQPEVRGLGFADERGTEGTATSVRRRALPLLAALAVGSIPSLALIGIAMANGVGGSGGEWIADVGGAVPRLLLRSWSGGSGWLWGLTVVLAGAGIVLGRGRARVVGAAWLGVPVAAVAVVELVRPVYVDRYLLPALLGLALLTALGVAGLRPRWVGGAALAAVLFASGAATVQANGLGPKEDVRGAVDAVAATHVPGQPVVAAARWDALGLDHHARTRHPTLVADLVLPPAAVPEGARTVWVVRRAEGGVQGDEAKVADLDRELAARGLRLVEEQRFPGRYAATLAQRWSAPS